MPQGSSAVRPTNGLYPFFYYHDICEEEKQCRYKSTRQRFHLIAVENEKQQRVVCVLKSYTPLASNTKATRHWPAIQKYCLLHSSAFMANLCRRQIFVESPQYQISRKSDLWDWRWYMRVDRESHKRWDMTGLAGASLDLANARKKT